VRVLGNSLAAVVFAVMVIAVAAPILISLSHALVPVLIVGAVAAIVVRLVWFHTRRF
jgi:hypothetical protein